MKIIGFNFNKISVEKKSSEFRDTKIKNTIDVTSVDPVKNEILPQKEELVGVSFKFSIDYTEDKAKIELEGVVLLALDQKDSKRIIKEWKEKNLSDDFKIPLFNLILRKSNIKALTLSDEMNLPPHVKLPSLQIGDKK